MSKIYISGPITGIEDYMKNFVFTNTLDYTLIFEAYADGPQVVVIAYRER